MRLAIAKLISQIESERAENTKFRDETREFRQEIRTEFRVILTHLESIEKRMTAHDASPIAQAPATNHGERG